MKHLATFSLIVTLVFAFSGMISAQTASSQDMSQPHGQQQGMMQAEMMKQMSDQTTQMMNKSKGTVWIANGLDDNLSIIDLATGKVLTTITTGMNPHILSASPDGRIVYVINAGEHDREPGAHGQGEASEEVMREQPAETTEHHGAAAEKSPAGGEMAPQKGQESVFANSLWAFDASNGRILARIPVGTGPTHPIPSPDGRWVYVTNTDGDSVSVIDTSTWQVVATINDLPEPHDGEVTPDGGLLYLATSGNSTMTVVDTATRKVLRTFQVGEKPRGLVVGGENGQVAYLTNKGDDTLSIIDVPSGQITATVPVGKGAHALRISPDNKTVYVTLSKEDSVAVVDAATGEVLKRIPVGQTPEQIDLSPDGRWLLASNNAESTVSIIDTSQEEVSATIPVGRGAYGIQFTETPFILMMADMTGHQMMHQMMHGGGMMKQTPTMGMMGQQLQQNAPHGSIRKMGQMPMMGNMMGMIPMMGDMMGMMPMMHQMMHGEHAVEATNAEDSALILQMQGEMMKAMGEILLKYGKLMAGENTPEKE